MVTIPKRETNSNESSHLSVTPDLDRKSGTVLVRKPPEPPPKRFPPRPESSGTKKAKPITFHPEPVKVNDPFAETLGESTKAYEPSEFALLLRSAYREERAKALSNALGNLDLPHDSSVHECPTTRPPAFGAPPVPSNDDETVISRLGILPTYATVHGEKHLETDKGSESALRTYPPFADTLNVSSGQPIDAGSLPLTVPSRSCSTPETTTVEHRHSKPNSATTVYTPTVPATPKRQFRLISGIVAGMALFTLTTYIHEYRAQAFNNSVQKNSINNEKDVVGRAKKTANIQAENIIRFRVDVEPPEAKVYVDNQLLTRPLQREYRLDNTAHEVRAEAPGYVTKIVKVKFDRDVLVVLSLGIERLQQ